MNEAAICAGTYDPLTLGHLDVIERATRIFPRVVVAVASNPGKNPLFSLEERIRMIRASTEHLKGVEVDSFDGLLVNFAEKKGVKTIVRGLRAFSDFEYEFQMALMNRRQTKNVETVFLMSGFRWFFTSSNLIKEVASFGGSVKGLVPDNVHQKLIEKYNIKK